MSTYQEIKAQISELENLAEEAQNEVAQAKEQIAKIMSDYGLTIEDLVPAAKRKPSATRRPVR
jgi:DNA-binding protein H-NS